MSADKIEILLIRIWGFSFLPSVLSLIQLPKEKEAKIKKKGIS